VDLLTTPDGDIRPADDFDVAFRAGWNDEGLLVLARVRDDVPREHSEENRLWRLDCLEIFVAEGIGSTNRYQLVLTAGADPEQPALRYRIYDHRAEKADPSELTVQCARQIGKDGITVEALLPWRNLGITPADGRELALQVIANDNDGQPGGDSCRVAWFPSIETHRDSTRMYPVLLSSGASPPVRCRVRRDILPGECRLTLTAALEALDAPWTVEGPDGVLADGRLAAHQGRAGALIQLTREPGGEWPDVRVAVDGATLAAYAGLPALEDILQRHIDAIGGGAALRQQRSRICRGHFRQFLNWTDPQKTEFPAEVFAGSTAKWQLAHHEKDVLYHEGFDGTVRWRVDGDGVHKLSGWVPSVVNLALVPQGFLHLREMFPTLRLRGREERDGRPVLAVDAVAADGGRQQLYFDEETGRLTRIGVWQLENYRTVDGVAVPTRLFVSRKGGWSAYEFDEIIHNQPLDERRFDKPDPAAVFTETFAGITDPQVLPLLKHLPYDDDGMNIPCRDGRLLYDLIAEHGYVRGLEIGTSNGYSTLWLGLAFRQTGGRVITLEYEAKAARAALRNFQDAGLTDVIDARTADAFQAIPDIEGDFDFIFLDAWKPDYIRFWRLVKDRVRPGGVFTAHNVSSHERDMKDFLVEIRKDPDFETTLHQVSTQGVSVSFRRKQP
jgi:predicted O-methyltransferase YrrM